jgi:hypothetical protein
MIEDYIEWEACGSFDFYNLDTNTITHSDIFIDEIIIFRGQTLDFDGGNYIIVDFKYGFCDENNQIVYKII